MPHIASKGTGVSLASSGYAQKRNWFAGEPVIGDPGRLGQVVDNLLSDAITFTPPVAGPLPAVPYRVHCGLRLRLLNGAASTCR
jgi:signal transduction histidine kinase